MLNLQMKQSLLANDMFVQIHTSKALRIFSYTFTFKERITENLVIPQKESLKL